MARRRPRPYNALAALNPKQQRSRAYSLLAPLIAQVNAEFDRRAAAGTKSIADYTDLLAKRLAPIADSTHGIYQAATDQQRADDKALADRLGAFGSTLGSQIGGMPGVSAGSFGDPARTGLGASNAGFASGSSKLAQLVAQGAATESYGRELPGIARLGGAQQGRDLTAQLESGRQGALSSARGQIPKILQQIGDTEIQKAIANQSGLATGARLAQTAAYEGARIRQGQQSLNLRAQQQGIDNLFKQARVSISQGQLALARQRETRLVKGKSGKAGGFTPSQIAKFRGTAIDTVKDWKHGVPAEVDSNNRVTKPEIKARPNDPRGAFRYLVLHGIPPSMADWAVGAVYGRWKTPKYKGRQ